MGKPVQNVRLYIAFDGQNIANASGFYYWRKLGDDIKNPSKRERIVIPNPNRPLESLYVEGALGNLLHFSTTEIARPYSFSLEGRDKTEPERVNLLTLNRENGQLKYDSTYDMFYITKNKIDSAIVMISTKCNKEQKIKIKDRYSKMLPGVELEWVDVGRITLNPNGDFATLALVNPNWRASSLKSTRPSDVKSLGQHPATR